MQANNPFTPTFGIIPPFMAGREELVEELSAAFAHGLGDPNLCTIVSGARGTGKTALLSFMGEEASSQGWICANTTAAEGMLEDIMQQAENGAWEFIESLERRHLSGITLGQFVGLEWENAASDPGNWRTRMSRLLDQLGEKGIGLLITVDEVRVTVPEMKQLARVYQHFVREGRNVALLMAGLPHSVSGLLNDEDVSFLRRARRHSLTRIPDREIREAVALTVEQSGRTIDGAGLDVAVEAIDGFPYMMQLVGYYMWAQHPNEREISAQDVARGVSRAQKEMIEGILEYTFRDLSRGDLRFLVAMLPDQKTSAMADVARRMGVKSNYASQYRRRLLEQGIIGEPQRGYLRFDMPGFRDYLAARLEEGDIT